MITITPLTHLDAHALRRVITGYTSQARYVVDWRDSDEISRFSLQLVPLAEPFTRRYDYLDEETLRRYQEGLPHGCSAGAYAGSELVGVALAEPQTWNNSLWVWEFHVAEAYRRQGIGEQLMAWLTARAIALGLRIIVCETQNHNVPAIQFYRHQGFQMEGVDISYYTNKDWPDGDVAVFMKKRLPTDG